MDLKRYWNTLWRRRWIIIITAVVTTAVVIVGTYLMTPVYTAATTLRVATPGSGLVDSVRYDIVYADRLMNTYARMVMSEPLMAELAQQFNLDEVPEIEVSIIANSELIDIAVSDEDPVLVSDVANQLAQMLIIQSKELDTGGVQTARELLNEQLLQVEEELSETQQVYDDLLSQTPADAEKLDAARQSIELKRGIYATLLEQYEQARFREGIQANTVSVIEPATVPDVPVSPNKLLNIALGVMVGLAGGVGLAFLFENLDTTLYTEEQIEQAADLSALGVIPTSSRKPEHALLNGRSPQAEAFRRLRTNLSTLDSQKSALAFLVTSAEPGEGKSTVTASLAPIMARFGHQVIIVDGDLRLPTVHKIFKLPNEIGLSTYLQQETSLDESIQDSGIPGVSVLTSGPLPLHPDELLDSAQMVELIEKLKSRFNLVLFDTPSVLSVTDATILAPLVDGVLLVVGRAQARRETVKAARRQLDDARARTMGIVINRSYSKQEYR